MESPETAGNSTLVPASEVFTNELLEDLEKIWALRDDIPDPTNPLCTFEKDTSQI